MKKNCLIIIGVFLSYYAFAQNIEGVKTGTSFSSSTNVKVVDESKVAQIFGAPERTGRDIGEDGSSSYSCFYGPSNNSDCIAFSDGELVFYGLRSPRFLVATDMFDGGIRVGDSLSVIGNFVPQISEI